MPTRAVTDYAQLADAAEWFHGLPQRRRLRASQAIQLRAGCLVFLDEWTDFRANLLEWYRMGNHPGAVCRPNHALALAASIARKGRTSRIRLIFGTQRLDTEFLTGKMRENFRKKIGMGRRSPRSAMMVWQSPVIGATLPKLVRGRASTAYDHVSWSRRRPTEPGSAGLAPGSDEQRLLDDLRPSAATNGC